MKILLVEDDEDKAQSLIAQIESLVRPVEIDVARSLNTALRLVIKGKDDYKLMLLDMSMPGHDQTEDDPAGGVPESLAGRDLLAQMKLRRIVVPTIVVTMFDKHGKGAGKMSLDELKEDLAAHYADSFRGLVYYNSSQEGWRDALKKHLRLMRII